MESISYLDNLEKISINADYENIVITDYFEHLCTQNSSDYIIEASFGVQHGLIALFDARNVPDDLENAFRASFTKTEGSLYDHYLEMLERGESSVVGFISSLKGKYFELQLPDILEKEYSGYNFEIPSNPTQPIWDIIGKNGEGDEILVQAKMWVGENASTLKNIMESQPGVLYATNREIREKIIEQAPELAEQFVPDIDFSVNEFTEEVGDKLEVLAENCGIDVPDELGDILPYVKEVVLGIRLLIDIVNVQRDFSRLKMDNKAKLAAFKVLVLFSKFGVTAVLSTVGTALGAIAGGAVGGAAGGICGTVSAGLINKEIQPYIKEIVPKLLCIDQDDMVYYSNKKRIDGLAYQYTRTRVAKAVRTGIDN